MTVKFSLRTEFSEYER